MPKITDIQICKLPYQPFFFVHAARYPDVVTDPLEDVEDVWLSKDGTWCLDEGSDDINLPFSHALDFAERLLLKKLTLPEELHPQQTIKYQDSLSPFFRAKKNKLPEEPKEQKDLEENQCSSCLTLVNVPPHLEFTKGIDVCYDCLHKEHQRFKNALTIIAGIRYHTLSTTAHEIADNALNNRIPEEITVKGKI